jgi:hypothetical protein
MDLSAAWLYYRLQREITLEMTKHIYMSLVGYIDKNYSRSLRELSTISTLPFPVSDAAGQGLGYEMELCGAGAWQATLARMLHA